MKPASTLAVPSYPIGALDLIWHRFAGRSLEWRLHWVLRLGVFLEFVGHGGCGVLTKAGWLPYFHALGIPDGIAWSLMPIVGIIDIVLGVATLLAPRRALLLYMASWGCFTALLRPAAGQGWFEFIERAYNYGVPMALLLLHGFGKNRCEWLASLKSVSTIPVDRAAILRAVLRGIVVLMLIGHGAYGVFTQKSSLLTFYQAAGMGVFNLPMETIRAGIGWFEIGLGVIAIFSRTPGFFWFLCIWKFSTEFLFVVSGASMACFEVVERGGSYVAPLAIVCLLHIEKRHGSGRFESVQNVFMKRSGGESR